ncbi:MAG: PKD domain-containing protein [Bacteroidales bacterium]
MKHSCSYMTLVLPLFFGMCFQAYSQPSIYKIEKLPFNSGQFNEIAPVIVKDGIIFCSDRRTSSITDGTTYQDERLYNIYYVEKKDSSSWGKAVEIKEKTSQLLYYGPVSVSSDGKTIYFTSSVITGKQARKKNIVNPRGIFIGDLSGTTISNVRPFEYNNKEYSVAHPSISRDGKYLFFASDMPGGQGGSDIWYCENLNGKWGQPVNPGSKVNSPSSENYPFIHSSGRLYFTSNRPGNADYLGGMDVYYTSLVYGQWDAAAPMPAPINSKADDFAFVSEDNMQTGYFSRKTGNSDDIWKFTSTIIRKAKCDTLQPNSYCYEFFDENAMKFDSIPFRYIWNFGDGSKEEGIKTTHCFQKPGKYLVTIDVTNLVTKETQKAEKTFDMNITSIEQPYISAPDNGNPGRMISLSADSTWLPGWNITQFYWNFGDESIAIGKEVTKAFTRPGVYNVQLIVTAPGANGGPPREACVFKNIEIRQP